MGSNIPTVIGVTSAHRNQGKTQLVQRIVEGLTKEGFKVGTIKHIGGNSTFDSQKVKDTTRHAEAGARGGRFRRCSRSALRSDGFRPIHIAEEGPGHACCLDLRGTVEDHLVAP